MNDNPIGIFDSGSGGLTVLEACRKILPAESYIYVSDSSGSWGGRTEKQIATRANKCVDLLLHYGVKAIVAACNTATAVTIDSIRERWAIPVVGIEPSVKPASEAFPHGRILVLTTPATARQRRFKELINSCNAQFIVRPQPTLASRIEQNLGDLDSFYPEVESIIAGENVAAVVLGCTHYVFLRDQFERAMGGADKVFDGCAGVARRLDYLLRENGLTTSASGLGQVTFDTI